MVSVIPVVSSCSYFFGRPGLRFLTGASLGSPKPNMGKNALSSIKCLYSNGMYYSLGSNNKCASDAKFKEVHFVSFN